MPAPPPLPKGDALAVAHRALTNSEAALATAQKALDVAHAAREQSNIAANHAIGTHTIVTHLSKRFDEFEGKVTGGFGRLERSLSSRASKHDLRALEDDVEDTKTHNLKAMVKAQHDAMRRWRNVVIALGVGVAIEVVRVILEHAVR